MSESEETEEDLSVSECALPAVPCSALPGTAEKILVMMRRASRGELLFHPDDARRE